MTAETLTPEQEMTARRLAAFEKASKGAEEKEALPKGVTKENFPEPVEETTPEEEIAEEPKAPKVDDEAKRRAVAALLRSGFDQAEIDAMPAERLLERGLKRHEILARDDDAHRRVRAQETSPKETVTKSLEPAALKPESAGVPKVDFMAAVKPFAEQYGLDDAGAKAMAASLEAAHAPLAAEIGALKDAREAEALRTLETMVSTARSALTESIPGLADEPTFESVVEDMVALQNLPRFQAIADPTERTRAVMQAAARSRGLPEQAQGDEPKKATRTARVVKQDPGGTARQEEKREMSALDRRYAAFQHLTKHPGDVAGAKKAAGSP